MAQFSDLMGLGISPDLSKLIDISCITTSCTGSTYASGYAVSGNSDLLYVTATNSGNFISIPAVGGATGCLVGDVFVIVNAMVNDSLIYATPANTKIYTSGVSVVGTTGVSVPGMRTLALFAITTSSYMALKFGV